ncbi:hypothetical protein RclHR1_06310018 [Rhizophagus clarus]|uniref:Uncharacterized protein n=1 Tax=Rhizophagus clarus TaxID=94130 RepID=A0A2Z6S9K4_9GLOM|nr:hypothetical protein RclHR1_06310018 [Rhizophagus clarus]
MVQQVIFVNEISLIVTTTSAHDLVLEGPSSSDDSDTNKSDSDANKSDSDVYFKSDNSDSNDEYDYELHERLLREEMAKLKDKIPTKPANEEDNFDKMLSKAIEKELAYFDNLASQLMINLVGGLDIMHNKTSLSAEYVICRTPPVTSKKILHRASIMNVYTSIIQ